MSRPDPPAAAISHPAVLPGPGSRSFRAYWAGEATALAGSSLHAVALPVVAVLELNATPGQVSLLTAAATLPAFALALPAGVLGGQCAKRPLMIATEPAAAVVVAAVPLSWAAGELSIPVLYAVAPMLGALTVLHQAAAIAIVPRDRRARPTAHRPLPDRGRLFGRPHRGHLWRNPRRRPGRSRPRAVAGLPRPPHQRLVRHTDPHHPATTDD